MAGKQLRDMQINLFCTDAFLDIEAKPLPVSIFRLYSLIREPKNQNKSGWFIFYTFLNISFVQWGYFSRLLVDNGPNSIIGLANPSPLHLSWRDFAKTSCFYSRHISKKQNHSKIKPSLFCYQYNITSKTLSIFATDILAIWKWLLCWSTFVIYVVYFSPDSITALRRNF